MASVSNRDKIILGGGLIAAGFIVVGLLLIEPAWKNIEATQLKIKEAETLVESLSAQEKSINLEIQRYQQKVDLPSNLIIREFKTASLDENIKIMLDAVIHTATAAGNVLVSLEPIASAPPPPPATPPAAPATPAVPGAAPPPPPPPPALRAVEYDMVVRGNYNNLVSFFKTMSEYNELVEIISIKMQNEGSSERVASGSSGGRMDPSKPIRLTAKFKLYLKPLI